MNWADLNLMPALPEMFLLGALSVILILDLFISDAKRGITYALSLLTLLVCAVIQVSTFEPFATVTLSGMFVDDPLSDIVKVAMKPYFIPDTTTLDEQMREFLKRRTHFALVVDEYGGLQGLITLEDILEEIVGVRLGGQRDEFVPHRPGDIRADDEMCLPRVALAEVVEIGDGDGFDIFPAMPRGVLRQIMQILEHILGAVEMVRDALKDGAGVFRQLGAYVLAGAAIVVPIWLLLRLTRAR